MKRPVQQIADLLLKRRRAYRQIFAPSADGFPPAAEVVLADLRRFCFATTAAFSDNSHRAARNLGRQEVFMRILGYCAAKDQDIYRLDSEQEISF